MFAEAGSWASGGRPARRSAGEARADGRDGVPERAPFWPCPLAIGSASLTRCAADVPVHRRRAIPEWDVLATGANRATAPHSAEPPLAAAVVARFLTVADRTSGKRPIVIGARVVAGRTRGHHAVIVPPRRTTVSAALVVRRGLKDARHNGRPVSVICECHLARRLSTGAALAGARC
jgi:hypothetical protein